MEDLEIKVATDLKKYTFLLQYDSNLGTVTVDGNTALEQEYSFGARPIIEIVPEVGFAVSSVLLNERDITGMLSANSCRIDSIKSDMRLKVEFEERTVGLTILGLEGGKITTLHPYGAQVRLRLTPDEEWKINTVTYNGSIVNSEEYNEGLLEIESITDDSEICVTFVNGTSSVNSIETGSNIRVYGSNRTINIDGADDDCEAIVSDVAGRVIYSGKDRHIPVPASGVYLVVIDNQTFKLML